MSNEADVVTYSVDGVPTSFNRAWPTYGLPLAEYARILTMLRTNQVDVLLPKAETLLDFAVYDARCRYSLLDGTEAASLTKALKVVSDYRQQYPRALDEASDKSWLKKERDVDAFLLQFRSNTQRQITNSFSK